MNFLMKLRERVRGVPRTVTTAALVTAAAITAGGLINPVAGSAFDGDQARTEKGPNVYVILNNHDAAGNDLSGQMSLPADKWYYDAAADGSYHMEFRLGSDKNTSTKNDVGQPKWQDNIRPFAVLGFGKYKNNRIGLKGYFGLSSTYGTYNGLNVDNLASAIDTEHPIDSNISFKDGAGNVRNFGILELPKVIVPGYECVGWNIEGRLGKSGSALDGDYTSSTGLYGSQNYYYNEAVGTSGSTVGKEWLWNEGWALNNLRTERHATFQGNPFSKANAGTAGGEAMAFRGTGKGYVVVCTPILKKLVESQENNHTVYLDLNGGSGNLGVNATNMSTFSYGGTCEHLEKSYAEANISREGYTFAGWNTAADGSGSWVDENSALYFGSDITLYAQWAAKDYTVTYNTGSGAFADGTRIISKSLPYGSSIAAAVSAPTRLGYTFVGWTAQKTGSVPAETVSGDMTVYACWQANDITVRFFSEGSLYATKTIKAGMALTQAVSAPQKDGYVFKGWVKSIDGEEYVSRAYENMDVYAFFFKKDADLVKPVVPEIKDYTYTEVTPAPAADLDIVANANGGTFGKKDGKDVTVVSCKVKKGADMSTAVNNPTRTGYTFDGWYTGAEGGSGASVANNSGVVYAHWKAVSCKVTFSAPAEAKGVPNAQTVDYGYDTSLFAAPTMKGATFAGWSDTEDGDGKVLNVYGDMTLYARFKVNTYTITFDANEGRFADNQTQVTRDVQEGDSFNRLDVPTRDGYDFKGWYTSKTAGALVETAEADQTVYAVWEKTKYTLTLVNNDGTATSSTKSVCNGEKIGDLPALTRDGYDFKGWNTSSAGTGSAITYDSVYDKNGDSAIFGIWEKHAYTLSFNDGTKITSRKIYAGEAIGEFPEVKKEHKKLVGWFLDDVQVGTTTVFNYGEDKTLTAKWESGSYTINYGMNTEGGDEPGAYRTTQLAKFDELVTLADSVDTRDGFTFKSWNTVADGSGKNYSAGAQVMNLAQYDGDETALYAQWKVNHYNISFDANKPYKANKAVVTGNVEDMKDVAYTDYVTVPECSYVVTGSALKVCFDGWNTKADGTGDSYAAGSQIGALTGVDGATVRLYAQWYFEINDENTQIMVGRHEVKKGDTIYSPIENPPFRLVADGYEIDSNDVKIDYIANGDGSRKVRFTVSGEFRGVIEKGFVIGKNPADGEYSFPEDFDNPNATSDPNASGTPGGDPNASSDPNATSDPNASGTPGGDPTTSATPFPTSTTIGLMTPRPSVAPTQDPNGGIEVPPGYELVTPPPSAREEYDYTITYCVLKGSKIENPVFGYKAGVGTTLPTKVTKDEYNFKGWYDNAKFTGAAILSIGPAETGDKLFYAKMLLKSEDPDENGRGDDNGNAPTATPDASGTTASPAPGINNDCPFKDNLEPNGGTVNRWNEDWTKDIIKLPTDVTRPGYIFGGWFLDPNFSGNPITEISRADLVAGVKVYAKWIPITYNITYVLNGIGKLPSGAAMTVTHGISTKLAIPVSDAYNFGGWYTDASLSGSKVTETGTGVLSDVTYYAKWNAIKKTKGGLIYQITGTNTATLVGTTNRGIKTLKVPKTVKLKCKGTTRTYKVARINGRAFQGCSKLKKVVIGGNVGVIGIYAFKNCKKLQTVTINGNKLLKIRQSAFSGDKKLKKVVIKSYKVNQIGKRAFRCINKKAKIYVRKRVKKTYTKMIKKKGLQTPKTVKVKAL